ncbi:MAG TPA: hypothetical protein VN636_11045 [Acidimicrobiia bacterium]|nr:hypothetical protein [Acidimicrobiia bacterium]
MTTTEERTKARTSVTEHAKDAATHVKHSVDEAADEVAAKAGASDGQGDRYELPVVHVQLPARAVNIGFWAVLGASTLVGAIEIPVAAAVGAGVVIARHRRGAR